MTDTTPDSGSPSGSPPPARRRWSGPLKITALVLISAFAGAVVSRAAHHWHGPGFHRGFMSGQMDPAEVDKRIEHMARHLSRSIDATPEQSQKLTEIAKSAAKDLLPMREKVREARSTARELLGSATVDRAAIEKLRSEQLANMEEASKRLSTALADAAEVLTPEQRKELSERMSRRHGWRPWWGKG